MLNAAIVVVVDDDQSVLESLPDLLNELGHAARAFASAEEFLVSNAAAEARCLILDIGLPGMSGPELQRELHRRGLSIPTIFITGSIDRRLPSDLFEHGAITCLFKPFNEQDLQTALELALHPLA